MAKKILDKETGLEFDSTHELYMYWYLKELQDKGYIERFSRSLPFILGEEVTLPYCDMTTGKHKDKNLNLLKRIKYTPDYVITWNDIAEDIFINTFDIAGNKIVIQKNIPFTVIVKDLHHSIVEKVSFLDVKNPSNHYGAGTLFSIKQKWVWQLCKMYVEKIEFKPLFVQTFTPQRYLFSDADPKKKRGAIRWTTRTLDEYVAIRQKLITEV